ncbi:MAG: hypothetical protein ACLR07_14475 [Christensenellales bacterium]
MITLVINFGDKKWDGPLTFHEMLTEQPEEVLALLPDYKVFLIDPMSMESEDFDKLHSSLREVLHCIKVQRISRKCGSCFKRMTALRAWTGTRRWSFAP